MAVVQVAARQLALYHGQGSIAKTSRKICCNIQLVDKALHDFSEPCAALVR